VIVEAERDADAARQVEALCPVLKVDQPIGIGIGQRVEHHALHDGEDGGIGADGERQGQDRCRRERRTAYEPPRRVPNLLPQTIHASRLSSGMSVLPAPPFA
jgi:hypothetical protein